MGKLQKEISILTDGTYQGSRRDPAQRFRWGGLAADKPEGYEACEDDGHSWEPYRTSD